MEIRPRSAALQLGAPTYFTGKPCKNGHVAERDVAGRGCVVCREEYARRYYEQNREKYIERDSRYYAENRIKILARQKAREAANPEEKRSRGRRYRDENPETVLASRRKHYLANRESVLEAQRKRHSDNPDAARAKVALRRARRLTAAPPWFGELDEFVWREAMSLARLRGELTGVPWAADHMVPLAARSACGLHVASNCQVIPSDLNGRKANKLILTEPDEWLQYI